MKRIGLFLILTAIVAVSCARLSVETTKPIQVDINMRVDIYQHVVKDVEDINAQIYGAPERNLNFMWAMDEVLAADDSDLQAAIERRKQRRQEIEDYFAQGYIGENSSALLVLRPQAPPQIAEIVAAENSDRVIIYTVTAQKNNVSLASVQKIFFQKDFERAPKGFWFETGEPGAFRWVQK